jgi:hypothetical protein
VASFLNLPDSFMAIRSLFDAVRAMSLIKYHLIKKHDRHPVIGSSGSHIIISLGGSKPGLLDLSRECFPRIFTLFLQL